MYMKVESECVLSIVFHERMLAPVPLKAIKAQLIDS